MSIMRQVRGIVGNLLIGLALKTYADDDPVKFSLALWIKYDFGRPQPATMDRAANK